VTSQVQRVDANDPSYNTLFQAYKTSNPDIFNNPDICWLYQVDGYTHMTIVSKLFEKTTKGGQGGAYGVKVGANYFTSNENNEIFHRFGLSTTVRKRPDGHIVSPRAAVGKPTATESAMLSRVKKIPVEFQ
jgi:hypothetical protein